MKRSKPANNDAYAGRCQSCYPCLHKGLRQFNQANAGTARCPIETMANRIEIRYCTQCRWLLRSSWMAQELLTTFEQEITELALQPATGGVFEVYVNEVRIWSRKEAGRFPEIAELKQLVRDRIAPGKGLGHADRKGVP